MIFFKDAWAVYHDEEIDQIALNLDIAQMMFIAAKQDYSLSDVLALANLLLIVKAQNAVKS